MSSSRFVSFVCQFDFSHAPVSLRVNKSSSYASFTGGLCSLVMILCIASFGALEMLKVFTNP